MEPRYRPYLTEPGETLLLAQSPLLSTTRFAQFLEESKLPMNRIVSSKMSSVPIPLYVNTDTMPNGRQFPIGTEASLLWHPLFWLPASLANHLSFRDASGNVNVETDDQWAARVALTLSTSGVYDADNGTWLDMLSVVGLDIEDEMTIDRLSEWLEGSDDPDIDRIDLTPFIDLPDQPHWAFRSVQAIFSELEQSSYALLTNGTLEVIDLIVEGNESVEGLSEEFADAVESLTLVMDGLSFDFDGEDFYEISEDVLQTAREYEGDWNSFVNGTIAYYRQVLSAVRQTFWPVVEALNTPDASAA